MSQDHSIDDAPTTEAGFALGEAVVGGRFRLGERLSWGGMGTVYRAIDLESGREVAVKLPHIGAPGATEMRFEREVRAVASLVCSSVIGYVGHGSHDEPFLAMELVHGDPLVRRLQEGPIDEVGALHVARRVASALAAIHLGGWVHRDVKPGNIVVAADGAIKLLDFGLSRTLQGDATATVQGDLVGTLGYMAPEQLRGKPIIDARTDVFSLGVVLYECLTGKRAYHRTMADLAKRIPEPPLDVRGAGIDGKLAALIESMVAHDPEARPADGVEALARLLWLDMGELAKQKLGAVRAALRHALRAGAVNLSGPWPGSATSSAASVASLLAEIVAPSDVVVLSADPSFTHAPRSHVAMLAQLLAERGFMTLARRLGKGGAPSGDQPKDPERRIIVLLEDAPWCDPSSAEVLRELVLDRSIALVVAGFVEGHREPTLSPQWPTVAIDAVPDLDVSFERLSPLARWVLKASAMFGRNVPTLGVADLVGGAEAEDVAHVLEHLTTRRLTYARPGSNGFGFCSSLALDAARTLASPGETRLGTELARSFRARHDPSALPPGGWAIASEEAHVALARPSGASR